jgi:hypothetical protein
MTDLRVSSSNAPVGSMPHAAWSAATALAVWRP